MFSSLKRRTRPEKEDMRPPWAGSSCSLPLCSSWAQDRPSPELPGWLSEASVGWRERKTHTEGGDNKRQLCCQRGEGSGPARQEQVRGAPWEGKGGMEREGGPVCAPSEVAGRTGGEPLESLLRVLSWSLQAGLPSGAASPLPSGVPRRLCLSVSTAPLGGTARGTP